MKKLEAKAKIVQKMHRGAAIEVNKATGEAKHISSRKAEISHSPDSGIGTLASRIKSERKAKKKYQSRKANAKLFEQTRNLPIPTRLYFPEKEKAAPVLKNMAKDRLNKAASMPGRGLALIAHSKVSQSDNIGVRAAHLSQKTASAGTYRIGQANRKMKFRHERTALKTHKKTTKSNVNALYHRSMKNNPGLKSANPIRRALHKRRIKKEYVKNLRQAQSTAKHTKRIAARVTDAVKRIIKLALGKGKIIAAVISAVLVLSLASSCISSLMAMFSGSFNAAMLSTFLSEDEDMLGAHEDYRALENALAAQIDRIEDEHHGYDEYRYFLDVIGHDPYTLVSYLSAKYVFFTREQVQNDLQTLFRLQYNLTLTPIVEIRTRVETRTRTVTVIDEETGEETETEEEYEEEVEYEYHILEIHLRNRSLAAVIFPLLSEDELEMYRLYMATLGNRPDLFEESPFVSRGGYIRYEIPPEALEDEVFARMIAEAEKYLGWPYVWGGSSPSSSFDCSGFVSWVINNTGWNVGRLGALGLYNICTIISPSEARPGDLIFFNHTYAAPQPHLATHVGIYAGGGMMIHAGNPISYVSIHTPYWTRHFMAFGRLPEPNY